MGAYQTAKWAVEGFSEDLANEVRPFGVKVTIIEPGAFRTDFGRLTYGNAAASPDYDQTVGEMNRHRQATFSSWPGEPARAAQIVTDLVRLEAEVSRSADFGATLPPGGVAHRGPTNQPGAPGKA